MSLDRALRHMFASPWLARSAFSLRGLERIEAAIASSEEEHRGEIRFAVEGALEFLPVLRGLTSRSRALEVFSLLRVWDTEENTGVLVYVQLVDRDIEIVADRGINACITQAEWDAICGRMESAFRQRRYEAGVLEGIAEINRLLARHFPAAGRNPHELPDQPVVL